MYCLISFLPFFLQFTTLPDEFPARPGPRSWPRRGLNSHNRPRRVVVYSKPWRPGRVLDTVIDVIY